MGCIHYARGDFEIDAALFESGCADQARSSAVTRGSLDPVGIEGVDPGGADVVCSYFGEGATGKEPQLADGV